MNDVLQQVKAQLEDARKNGRIPQNMKDKEFSPFANKKNMAVYLAIKKGHRAGNHGHLVGCTDEELRKTLSMNHNTVRWARYSMSKGKYIKYAGFTRGGVKGKVWIVNPEMPVEIPDTPPDTLVVKLSECEILTIVKTSDGKRFLVVRDERVEIDGFTGELMIPTIRLHDPDRGTLHFLSADYNVTIEGNIND